jgi:hypothetical protein
VLALRGEDPIVLTDPGLIFLDDLTAANRLKVYLLSNGADVPKEVVKDLADLTERYGSGTESLFEGQPTGQASHAAQPPSGAGRGPAVLGDGDF